ncbi:MAG: selenide, water dikinase SelD [Verrucomicrobiota bacterium]
MSEYSSQNASETVRLTSLSSCAGCASKLGQRALAKVLSELPHHADERLLVGNATSDDAGVFAIGPHQALVQTTDFFTPIVDDPYTYGQIAATNALSDVYAMGGRPITALALAGMPDEVLLPETIREIFLGGSEKAKEAKCSILGGHTIRVPEPIYGLACTGLIDPDKLMTNAGARPGDWLVMTKPLGTGIITTGIKRGHASGSSVESAVRLMTTLNSVGAEIAERGLCKAATDVTGFGLLGHLKSMCLASGVSVELESEKVPIICDEVLTLVETHDCVPGGSRENFKTCDPFVEWADAVSPARRALLADAQTSGGLLLSVAEAHLAQVIDTLVEFETLAQAVIGRVVDRADAEPLTMRVG